MFHVRNVHMYTIGRNVFVDRVKKFLIEEFPESSEMDQRKLRTEIARQVEKAESCGLKTERAAAKYVVTAWLLGPGFDSEFEAAKEVLTSNEFTSEEKADWLEEWTTAIFEALESE